MTAIEKILISVLMVTVTVFTANAANVWTVNDGSYYNVAHGIKVLYLQTMIS